MKAKVKPCIVKMPDNQMRAHTFTGNTWKQLTGKTVDELWKSYTGNSTI